MLGGSLYCHRNCVFPAGVGSYPYIAANQLLKSIGRKICSLKVLCQLVGGNLPGHLMVPSKQSLLRLTNERAQGGCHAA